MLQVSPSSHHTIYHTSFIFALIYVLARVKLMNLDVANLDTSPVIAWPLSNSLVNCV